MERNLFSLKKDIEVIQTTKPSWAIETENNLMGLEDSIRRNNLRINGIKEGKNETWEECEERVNCFLEEKLDMDTSEIWIERADNSMNHNPFELPQYKSIHQVRRAGKGGGIAVFLREPLTFNIRHDLSVNNADIEALCVEIINKKSKNILINTQYRQPVTNFNVFEANLNIFLANPKTTDKKFFLVGDLNLNLINYHSDPKVRNFVNLIFQHNLVPIVNKPTRVTKNNATLIDYIITNSFIDQENLTGILKTDISDHFPIFNISMKHGRDSRDKKVILDSRIQRYFV